MNISPHQFAWLRLIRDQRWSARQKRELLKSFTDAQTIYAQTTLSMTEVVGAQKNAEFSDNQSRLELDADWLRSPDHHLITLDHPSYPELLKEITDPPIAMFAKGDLSLLEQPSIAIVGSRRPTPIGAQLASKLAAELSSLGLSITSGMALGIDGLAHRGVLDVAYGGSTSVKGGTIAVLGCGVDCIYPARHRGLYQDISEQGLLLSEYPLGMRATRFSFPQRNRIVSGLSLGVIIVEAAQKSGTLITARLAMEQNREVMVVPGSALSRQYQGSHQLIMQGAALVVQRDDVLHVLQTQLSQILNQSLIASNDSQEQLTVSVESAQEHPLLRHISTVSTSIDQIISDSGLTTAQVSAMLLTLEVEGLIAAVDDGGYLNLS